MVWLLHGLVRMNGYCRGVLQSLAGMNGYCKSTHCVGTAESGQDEWVLQQEYVAGGRGVRVRCHVGGGPAQNQPQPPDQSQICVVCIV